MARHVMILASVFLIFVALSASQPVAPQFETTQQQTNDDATLNYALYLEHLEAAYYTAALNRFNASAFIDEGFPAGTFEYISLIRAHEENHVNLLTSVLNSRGAIPVQPCTYNFDGYFDTIQSFLTFARDLEETEFRHTMELLTQSLMLVYFKLQQQSQQSKPDTPLP